MLHDDPVDMFILCAHFNSGSEDICNHQFRHSQTRKCKLTMIWHTRGISSYCTDIIEEEAALSWLD